MRIVMTLGILFLALLGSLLLYRPLAPSCGIDYENIYPELIGFSLEGLFFVSIFSLYQLWRTKQKERHIKESLNVMVFRVIDRVAWAKLGELREFKPGESIELVLDMYKSGNESFHKKWWAFAVVEIQQEISTYEAMLPVVSNLEVHYLRLWLDLIKHLKQVADMPKDHEELVTLEEFTRKIVHLSVNFVLYDEIQARHKNV